MRLSTFVALLKETTMFSQESKILKEKGYASLIVLYFITNGIELIKQGIEIITIIFNPTTILHI